MSFFRRRTRDSADLIRVKSEIGRLAEALERHDERAKQFDDAMFGQPDGTALAGRLDATDVVISERSPSEAIAARLDDFAARLDALEGRVTSVSTELANQLSELGNDIEALKDRPAGEPIDDDTIEELRDTQSRLANEQARYQIAFREDLARLAEQLRKPPDPYRRRPS